MIVRMVLSQMDFQEQLSNKGLDDLFKNKPKLDYVIVINVEDNEITKNEWYMSRFKFCRV